MENVIGRPASSSSYKRVNETFQVLVGIIHMVISSWDVKLNH